MEQRKFWECQMKTSCSSVLALIVCHHATRPKKGGGWESSFEPLIIGVAAVGKRGCSVVAAGNGNYPWKLRRGRLGSQLPRSERLRSCFEEGATNLFPVWFEIIYLCVHVFIYLSISLSL